MDLVESRILGIQIDETGRNVVLSLIDTAGTKSHLELTGVERVLITEVRQQNVIEGMTHWVQGASIDGLREAAFALMTGAVEKDCDPSLAMIALGVVDRVVRGELAMMEIRAIFGAEVLSSFASLRICPA